jgi:ferredoxin
MYSKIIALNFPKEIVDQPIVVNLAKKFDLTFNILKATIFPRKEGVLVMELQGHKKNFKKGVEYLRGLGISVSITGQDVRKNEEKCYHCGVCTAVCPTGALHISRPDMEVLFDPERCSACEMCVAVCPARAMEVRLGRVETL